MTYRKTITTVALGLFAERGFKNTSVAELSKHSGAAEGTIFHHFKNKEQLFKAVLDEVRTVITEAIEQIIEEAEDCNGLDTVERLMTAYFIIASEKPQVFQILLQDHPHQMAGVDDACRDSLEAIYEAFLSPLEKAIRRGISDGSIREVDSGSQAMTIFAILEGLVRFRLFRLWSSTQSHLDAIDFCRSALAPRQEARC